MTTPTPHHLTITLPGGKFARGKVVYLQPKAERWREQTATVHILCSEWLDPNWYSVIYSAGAETYSGRYMPASYEMTRSHDWLYKGTFERDEDK